MNKFTLFLCFCSVVFLASCSNERLLDNKLRKMNGSWSFHKVTYKSDSKLFSENITDEYEETEWVFTEFGDVMQINHEDADTAFGSFELELIEECEDFNSDCENIYFIHLYMIDGQSVNHFIWEDARIRNQKIVATEWVERGRYNYILRKI